METIETRVRIPICAHDVYCQDGPDTCIMLCLYDGYCFLKQEFLESAHNKYLKPQACINYVKKEKEKKRRKKNDRL